MTVRARERGWRSVRKVPALALLAISAACSAAPAARTPAPAGNLKVADAMTDSSQPRPIAGLPFAQGRAFASLDDYLAFRRSRGAYDVPWYREVRPGVYELMGRRGPGAEPKVYTRDELERKFGFRR
jgi:hypothetical protein